jgi:hypothetical protein
MVEQYISLFLTFVIYAFLIYALFDGLRIFKRALNKRF